MSWTLTTSGTAIVKAGVHANSTIILSGTAMAKMSDDAEGFIQTKTKRAWIDTYASLPVGIQGMLSEVVSSVIAMEIIAYDTSGYLAREADMLMNSNDEKVSSCIRTLENFDSNTLRTPN